MLKPNFEKADGLGTSFCFAFKIPDDVAASNEYWVFTVQNLKSVYRKVASSNTSHLEVHAGFYRLFMKGIFNAYVL